MTVRYYFNFSYVFSLQMSVRVACRGAYGGSVSNACSTVQMVGTMLYHFQVLEVAASMWGWWYSPILGCKLYSCASVSAKVDVKVWESYSAHTGTSWPSGSSGTGHIFSLVEVSIVMLSLSAVTTEVQLNCTLFFHHICLGDGECRM